MILAVRLQTLVMVPCVPVIVSANSVPAWRRQGYVEWIARPLCDMLVLDSYFIMVFLVTGQEIEG